MEKHKSYNLKIIKTGKYTEVYFYHDKSLKRKQESDEELFIKQVRSWAKKDEEEIKLKSIELTDKEKEFIKNKNKKIKREVKSIKKSKNNLRRLINCNLNQYQQTDKFLTLTYSKEMKSREQAYKDLKTFIKNIRRAYSNEIGYIAVMELQDGSRRKDKNKKKATNNIHWHVLLFNMPYVEQPILQKRWGKGHVWINALKKYNDIAGYLTNYLGDDELLTKTQKKSYTSSIGLKRPLEELANDLNIIPQLLNEKEKKLMFNSNYIGKYTGSISYYKFINV